MNMQELKKLIYKGEKKVTKKTLENPMMILEHMQYSVWYKASVQIAGAFFHLLSAEEKAKSSNNAQKVGVKEPFQLFYDRDTKKYRRNLS